MGDTWAPREGAYGRTRDGQRVGPLRAFGYGFIEIEGDGRLWEPDGRFVNEMRYDMTRDLVAEWTEDGPVRTVTRREIVPGTYGRLGVGQPFEGVVPVGWVGHHHTSYPRLNADELDAAARVLTQLAEALRDGQ